MLLPNIFVGAHLYISPHSKIGNSLQVWSKMPDNFMLQREVKPYVNREV